MASTHGYTNAADIKRLLHRITQSEFFDTDGEIEIYISEAEEVINSMISERYQVPLTSTIPPIIKYITGRITAYNILMSEFTGDSVNISDWTKEWYDKSLEILEKINKREIKLVDSSGVELVERVIIQTHRTDTPLYDLDGEFNQKLDSDLINKIGEERS